MSTPHITVPPLAKCRSTPCWHGGYPPPGKGYCNLYCNLPAVSCLIGGVQSLKSEALIILVLCWRLDGDREHGFCPHKWRRCTPRRGATAQADSALRRHPLRHQMLLAVCEYRAKPWIRSRRREIRAQRGWDRSLALWFRLCYCWPALEPQMKPSPNSLQCHRHCHCHCHCHCH